MIKPRNFTIASLLIKNPKQIKESNLDGDQSLIN